MERFYYGLTGGGTDKRIGDGDDVPGMISAATLWLPKSKRFKSYRPPNGPLFLDSGGFSFHSRNSDYPFGVEEYADLARQLRAEHVATLDYPCEPKVNREAHATNAERILRTAMNAANALFLHPSTPWVPVIQGYTPAEYRQSIALLEDMGAIRPYMAVGSMCTRARRTQTWEVLRVIRRALPDVRLHGFGVSLHLLKDRKIARALYSADSQAWRFFDHFDADLGRRIWRPRTIMAQVRNYPRYAQKVARVMTCPPGRPLEAFA